MPLELSALDAEIAGCHARVTERTRQLQRLAELERECEQLSREIAAWPADAPDDGALERHVGELHARDRERQTLTTARDRSGECELQLYALCQQKAELLVRTGDAASVDITRAAQEFAALNRRGELIRNCFAAANDVLHPLNELKDLMRVSWVSMFLSFLLFHEVAVDITNLTHGRAIEDQRRSFRSAHAALHAALTALLEFVTDTTTRRALTPPRIEKPPGWRLWIRSGKERAAGMRPVDANDYIDRVKAQRQVLAALAAQWSSERDEAEARWFKLLLPR